MFNRLRSVFSRKPRAGDLVTVVEGPRAGQTGTVGAVRGVDIVVDLADGTEHTLAARSLRIVRRVPPPRGTPAAGSDLDYEEARARINQIPPPMV